MKIINTSIQDVYIIEPDVFKDARGYFFESWNQARFAEARIIIRNPFTEQPAASIFKKENIPRQNWCGFWKEQFWTLP